MRRSKLSDAWFSWSDSTTARRTAVMSFGMRPGCPPIAALYAGLLEHRFAFELNFLSQLERIGLLELREEQFHRDWSLVALVRQFTQDSRKRRHAIAGNHARLQIEQFAG